MKFRTPLLATLYSLLATVCASAQTFPTADRAALTKSTAAGATQNDLLNGPINIPSGTVFTVKAGGSLVNNGSLNGTGVFDFSLGTVALGDASGASLRLLANAGGNHVMHFLSNTGGNTGMEFRAASKFVHIIANTAGEWYFFVNSGTTNTPGTAALRLDASGNVVGFQALIATKAFLGSVSAVTAETIDWSSSNTFTKTLSANTTFTFAGMTSGQTITVAVTNTAGNYTVTWPTVAWPGGVAPVQTTGAKTDVYTFVRIGAITYGSVVQNF